MNMVTTQTQRAKGNVNSVAVIALVFFAIAGLIGGMAVGAFTSLKPSTHTTPPKSNPPVVKSQKTGPAPSPTATTTAQTPFLGTPQVPENGALLQISGPSSLNVQAVNKANLQPVHDSTITCRLWLTDQIPPTKDDPVRSAKLYTALMSVGTLSQPLPEELPNTLVFSDPTLPATHFTDSQGLCKWNFQFSPALSQKPGKYYLVADTDWKGLRYPWIYFTIDIPKP